MSNEPTPADRRKSHLGERVFALGIGEYEYE